MTALEMGRAQVVRPSSDLTIVAAGVMVARAQTAADTLSAAARDTGAIATPEE